MTDADNLFYKAKYKNFDIILGYLMPFHFLNKLL